MKKLIPYQAEFQAPPRGKTCWLECPYCYGLSAEDNGERPTKPGLEILNEILMVELEKLYTQDMQLIL